MDLLMISTILSIIALISGFLIQRFTKDELRSYLKHIIYAKSILLFFIAIALLTVIQNDVLVTIFLVIVGIMFTIFFNEFLFKPHNDSYIRIASLGLIISASFKVNLISFFLPLILLFLILQGISTAYRAKKLKEVATALTLTLLISILIGAIIVNEINYWVLYNLAAGILFATIIGRL